MKNTKNNELAKISLNDLANELKSRRTKAEQEIAQVDTIFSQMTGKSNVKVSSKAGKTVKKTATSKSKKTKKSVAQHTGNVGKIGKSEDSIKSRLMRAAADGETRTIKEYVDFLEKDGWSSTSENTYFVVGAALATLVKKQIFVRTAKATYKLAEVAATVPAVSPAVVQNEPEEEVEINL